MTDDDAPEAGGGAVVPLGQTVLDRLDRAQRERVLEVLRPFSPRARRMTGMQRLDALLSVPDPQRFVPELPTESLYFFLQDIGLQDCTELVRYASDEQLQGFVDLGAWRRDSFDLDLFRRWFEIAAYNGPEEVQRLLGAVDPELVVLMLLRHAEIFDARDAPEQIPDDRTQFPTPDGAFIVEVAADEDRLLFVKAVLDAVYAKSVEDGHKLILAARWELASELEESCYQWRAGRLWDLGFLPFDEAIEAERDIDVALLERALQKGTTADEPGLEPGHVHPFTGWYLAKAGDAPYLARVLDEVPDGPLRDRVLFGFSHLVSRRLSLRGFDLAEWESLEEEAGYAFRMVSIGLERLARASGRGGVDLLGRLPLLAAYRVGRTLLARLQRRAATVTRRADAGVAQPFDSPLDWWLEALRATPPHRFGAPATAAVGSAAQGNRQPRDFFVPFRALAEVEEAERWIVQAEAVLQFFERRYAWGPDRFSEPDLVGLDAARSAEARFSTLLLTGMANRILDRSTDLRPLSAEDVRDLLQMLFVQTPHGRALDPRLKREAQEQLLGVSGRMSDSEREAVFAFVSESLGRFEEALAGLPADETPDPRFLGDLLLVAG